MPDKAVNRDGIRYGDHSQERLGDTVECPNNCGNNTYLHGHFGRNKTPRFKCRDCKRTFSDRTRKPVKTINLPDEKLFRILDCLAEGCSVRSTARLVRRYN